LELTPDTIARSAMFAPSFVRTQTLNMERLIVGQICLADGHPRRSDFVTAQEMRHGDPLPSSVGGVGAVTEGEGKNALYYENRPIGVVDALRSGEQIDVQKFIQLMTAQRTPIKVDLDFASRGSQ
jgi:hypothetical protein